MTIHWQVDPSEPAWDGTKRGHRHRLGAKLLLCRFWGWTEICSIPNIGVT
jgi:hypothetical protein